MKLSNIRIEDVSERGIEKSRLVCDVDNCPFSQSKQIFFEVPREYKDWLADDVYDSFMVALYFPIMRYNEPLEIDGNVSKKLHINLLYDIASSQKDFDNSLFMPVIKVKGYADAKKNSKLHVGEAFTAGVDSLATFHDNYWHPIDEDRKIDTLFFFHADNTGGDPTNPEISAWAYDNYLTLTKAFADKVGIPSCYVDNNMFEFHPKHGTDRYNGWFARMSMILSIQRALRCFYISADLTYGQSLNVVEMYKYQSVLFRYWYYTAQPYACPMLSPKGLDIIPDGAIHTRDEKLELISNDPYVKDFLNVCGGGTVAGKNCSHCRKCITTMLALDIMGKLDDFKDVFDIDYYRKYSYTIKCRVVYLDKKEEYSMVDVELAKKHNYKLPSKLEAFIVYRILMPMYNALGVNKIRRLIQPSRYINKM